jgi:hypothetical protein
MRTCSASRSLWAQCDDGEPPGDEGGDGEDRHKGTQTTQRPALERAIPGLARLLRSHAPVALGNGCAQEAFVIRSEGEGCVCVPVLELLEAGARHEKGQVTAGSGPIARCGGEPSLHAKIPASRVDPPPESGPLTQQGFMGHLDGRDARAGVAVEREQPRSTERLDDRQHGRTIGREREELGAGHAPACITGPLARRDES